MWNCEVYSNWPLIKRRPDALKRKARRQVWHQKVCWTICLKCVGEDDEIVRMLPARNSENVNWRAVNFYASFPIPLPRNRFFSCFSCFISNGQSIWSFVPDKRCPALETNVKLHVLWWIFFYTIWKQSSSVNLLWMIHERKDNSKQWDSCFSHSFNSKVYKILNSKFYLV